MMALDLFAGAGGAAGGELASTPSLYDLAHRPGISPTLRHVALDLLGDDSGRPRPDLVAAVVDPDQWQGREEWEQTMPGAT